MTTESITTVLFVALALVAGIGGVNYLLYWRLMQRPLPRLEGRLPLAGLSAPVDVRRDRHGIPHLTAESAPDLFRAMGFTHAQDRFWQMEQSRRLANGEMAALLGESLLEVDRFARTIGFRRVAEAELALLAPETAALLDAYCAGVNAYLASHTGRVAAELNLLRTTPRPWEPVDTLAILKQQAWSQSLNWESELTRLRLALALGDYRAAELEPDYPARNPILSESLGSGGVERLLTTAGFLLNQYEALRPWYGNPGAGGSNVWALAPAHSLNGRPLLCADPHLPVTRPAHFYEMQLTGGDFDVTGATVPGIPAIFHGHNQALAWGMANAMIDCQDLFIEAAAAEPDHFLADGEPRAATVVDEIVFVRHTNQRLSHRVVVTRHGPLLNAVTGETTPLAVSWPGHQPGDGLTPLLALARANRRETVETALAQWRLAPQTVVYADGEGNIGSVVVGQIPLRAEGHTGTVPAPGWSSRYDWQGMIPARELPTCHNPPGGKIVAANQKLAGDEYPHFLGLEFDPGWRAARIEEILAEKERHTIRDMEEIQLDTVNKYAQLFTPWFTLLQSEDPWEKLAIQQLRKWNWRMESDSAAALIFHFYLSTLLEMVFGDKVGSHKGALWGEALSPTWQTSGFRLRTEGRLLELIQQQAESPWYAEQATRRQRSREMLMQEALTKSVRALRAVHGDSLLKWHWGRSHQIKFIHPLGKARLFGSMFDRGPIPVSGDENSPCQTRAGLGLPPGLVQVVPVWRQICEVGVWDRTQTVLAGGQSGHPLSRQYDDQAMMWRDGVYHAAPFSPEAVAKATTAHLVLQPL